MTAITLLYIRIKQSMNSLFIYSKKGYFLLLFEIIGAVSLIYFFLAHYTIRNEISFLFYLSFSNLLGYGYLSAEKYLSSKDNLSDLLAWVQAKNIIWSIYGQVFIKNISIITLFPLIIIASTKTISPFLIVLMFLLYPGTATLMACFCNIMTQRYCRNIAAIIYFLFSFLWGGSSAAILYLLLANHNLYFGLLDNHGILLILIVLFISSIIILSLTSPLAEFWKEAYLLKNSTKKYIHSFIKFKQLNVLISNSFVAKEWVLLWRNMVTRLRFMVWIVLIITCIFTPLKFYLYNPQWFFMISIMIWIFCYGELPATSWQNEGLMNSFYWTGGLTPVHLIVLKIITYLPLTILGVFTVWLLGNAVQLNYFMIMQRAGLVFLLTASIIIIALAIASLGNSDFKSTINNSILEQVPLTPTAIIAVGMEFIFCCVVFLPTYWIFLISITISIICLIVQMVWLNKRYYLNGDNIKCE